MNTDITYCASTECDNFDKCRRALDDDTINYGFIGGPRGYSFAHLLRPDGTCEVGEK